MDTQNFNSEFESQNVQPQVEEPKKKDGMAIASLVVSIVALLIGCCCNGYLGAICGVVSLILGILSNKKEKNGMATAGIVISIVGLVLSVASIIISIVFVGSMEELMSEMGYY